MREDRHVLTRVLGLDEHFDGDVLVGKVTPRLALGISFSAEQQRRFLLHGGLVGLAHHLEVICLEVIVLDVLREVEDDVVAGAQDAVLGFHGAEELRPPCVLDAREHLGVAGDEAVAVAAEETGAQVVGFLHDLSFAKEVGHDVAVLGNHRLRAAGGAIGRGVGVEAAEVGPVVIAARALLILELDVVEVLLVLVESADDHRQVPPSFSVEGRVGVHDPLVAGRGDIHRTCLQQVVHGEGHLLEALHIALRDDSDLEVLVVEVLSGPHLQRLLGHLAGHGLDGHSGARERHTVDQEPCALGVRRVVEVEREELQRASDGLGLFALVGHVELEASGLVVGHTADALLVHSDDRILDLLRALVQHGAGAVEQRLALVLPGAYGGASAGPIDESPGLHHVMHDVARPHVAVEEVFHVVHVVQEVLFHEDVGAAVHGGGLAGIHHAGVIDVEVQMRLLVHLDREGFLAVVFRRLVVLGRDAEGHGGCDAELPHRSRDLEFLFCQRAFAVSGSAYIHRTSLHEIGAVEEREEELGGRGADYSGHGREGCCRAFVVAVAVLVRVGVGKEVVGEVGEDPVVGRGVGVLGGEVLAVGHRSSAIDVEVLHLVGGFEFLLLVGGHHVGPGVHGLAEVLHLVLLGSAVAVGQDDLVVDTLLRGTDGGVVNIFPFCAARLHRLLGVEDSEVRVVRGAQRAVNGLSGGVGLRLGFGLGAGEHQRLALLRQVGDKLLDDVLLRVNESGLDGLAQSDDFIAHEVEDAVLLVASGSYFHHVASLARSGAGLERGVVNGSDSHRRAQEDIRLHAQIEVCVGAHHGDAAVGGDVLVGGQRVGEGALSAAGEDEVEAGVEDSLCGVYQSEFCCEHHGSCVHVQSATSGNTQGEASLP